MKKLYNLLFLLLLIPFLGFSNDGTYITKQKNIKKTYIVNSNAGIDIENKYGNISVSTWDEDKIDLDITIKVNGPNENWVNEKLNNIDVNITALKSMVTAVTSIGTSSYKSKGSNNSFEINYVIKIPKNGSVKLLNKYGNIATENIFGAADIACRYGKISLGKLNSSTNNVKIEYCQNSTIDYIKNGNIEARYSGLKINESGNLNLDTNYTDLVILEGQNIKYDCNYGTFKFQKINSFSGAGNYLTISIGEISNSVNLDTNYSKINISTITSKANNVNINSGYSDVYLGYDMNYSFDFDINTRYGGIKSDNSLDVLVNETKNTSKRISGFNKKKGQNKVTINSNYGNVTLNKKQ
ncbi:hypothetical protein ACHRVK_11330 [Flavobacterium plurextorum]|uniref:Adhesin domain-containing protein n=1 Tax=Flavobacterium plurextorum TaxID=1114867 RepID=A0ABX4CYD0_9FLAO|nr:MULTISPECIES: hypothetical protein [Flavobacterium]OXB10575.1 hypothetical protein B0A81_03165 [Flavobacterium plurextorum]UUW07407.1 hypothetical protein NLG42_15000 [Flavobacterium plurextorum]